MADSGRSSHASRFPPQRPIISQPLYAQYPSNKLVQGAGVAIFHLRTMRVVVCYHSEEGYWFLPKGRKDQCETIEEAAVREGFEESGYRNRLLPLPLSTLQTHPDGYIPKYQRNVTDVVWIQLLPMSSTKQYLLHWFVAETVPAGIDKEISEAERAKRSQTEPSIQDPPGGRYKHPNPWLYQRPPPYPRDLKLKNRIALEVEDAGEYEPVMHTGTAANAEEALYQSFLLDVQEAQKKLLGTVEADVVRIGWDAIQRRMEVEDAAEEQGESHLLFVSPHDDH